MSRRPWFSRLTFFFQLIILFSAQREPSIHFYMIIVYPATYNIEYFLLVVVKL